MRQIVLFIVFIILIYACSRTCESDYSVPEKSPVDEMIKEMTYVPTYSIILYDMNTEGSFYKEYYHQYRVIKENENEEVSEEITDWQPVSKDFFMANVDNMGMEIVSKNAEGQVSKTAAPPGYGAYVGNEKYGQWVQRDGGSFWEFYGKFALMSHFFNMMTYPVGRGMWTDYRQDYYGRGRPYYGPTTADGRSTYGTNSRYNSSTNQRSRWASNKSNNSLKQRVRSSKPQSSKSGSRYSNFSRSRSGGYGK
jgi:hypothetical protein